MIIMIIVTGTATTIIMIRTTATKNITIIITLL